MKKRKGKLKPKESDEDILQRWDAQDKARIDSIIIIETEAKNHAVFSMVREIAEHLGISKEVFDQHFKERTRRFRDEFLEELEDTSPKAAGLCDTRAIEDVIVEEEWHPLFGPPPGDKQ